MVEECGECLECLITERPVFHRPCECWLGEKPPICDDARKLLSACLLVAFRRGAWLVGWSNAVGGFWVGAGQRAVPSDTLGQIDVEIQCNPQGTCAEAGLLGPYQG